MTTRSHSEEKLNYSGRDPEGPGLLHCSWRTDT
ncbi:hypothetical protein ID866_8378 [Astraeus odoratus]|nr:hypothetical protein ID866_8378 [Astraeus odoratus]